MNSTVSGSRNPTTFLIRYCALAAIIMAYGWGYRGTVGHEQGAMVPGALLGLALCLGANRTDWHRRSVLVGLFAAVGWAWGGSISYMEHTIYVQSDSYIDVLYGYAILFFLGGLWAGCGGAILGLGLTEPRSELEHLVRPLIVLGTALLAAYVYFALNPEQNEAYETFTVLHFHDGDWLSATITLVTSAIYWVIRPKDRKGTALFFWAAVAWWIGYGLLTKFGGLRLAPLHRSESWGGVLGVLIALMIYLTRRRNYAARMLCLYGCLGGGLAFSTAVFLRHPLILKIGPLANIQIPLSTWRFAEDTFGALMGLSLAFGTIRLLSGGIAEGEENCDQRFTDTFAAFVIVVALAWMNFRRHFDRVLDDLPSTAENSFLGLATGHWYSLVAVIISLAALYVLYRYHCGDRGLFPQSAYGKGTAVTLIVIGLTVTAELLDGYPGRMTLMANLCLWLPAALAAGLLISFSAQAEKAGTAIGVQTARSDDRWRVGKVYYGIWVAVPLVLLGFASLTTAMQNDSHGDLGRLRFGEQAYWRQTARLRGTWNVIGISSRVGGTIEQLNDIRIRKLNFDTYRNVVATLDTGETVDEHRWFLKNQYIWLHWYNKDSTHAKRAEVPLQFHDSRIFVSLPNNDTTFLVLERSEE